MKKKAYFMVLWAAFMSSGAQAGYLCKGLNQEVSMIVNEKHMTRIGNASASLIWPTGTYDLFGTMSSEGGIYFKEKVINFYPFQGQEVLTIITTLNNCGRVPCNYDKKPVIKADLKMGEEHIYFSCQALSHQLNP